MRNASQPASQTSSGCPVGQLSTGWCRTTLKAVVSHSLWCWQASRCPGRARESAAPWWCFQALHPAHSRLRSLLETLPVTSLVVWNPVFPETSSLTVLSLIHCTSSFAFSITAHCLSNPAWLCLQKLLICIEHFLTGLCSVTRLIIQLLSPWPSKHSHVWLTFLLPPSCRPTDS